MTRSNTSSFENRPMAAKLAEAIHQDGPFSCLEQEACVNLLCTADALVREFDAFNRDHGVSASQYNVLRILRRHREQGCACKTIGESLITRDPDVTRLLDRLEQRGLITRARSSVGDRRVVTARITEAGLRLIDEMEPFCFQMHKDQLGHLSEKKLKSLILMLERVRELQSRRLKKKRVSRPPAPGLP